MPDIYESPVIGIDLGASFTKVAYRPAWNNGRRYDEPCRLVMIDGNPLVPSLVIHTNDKRKPWLCGQDAAVYRPRDGERVFTNWKADLFSDALTTQVSASLKAAGQFFGWLHEKISDAGIDVAECRVKVCLPAFENVDGPASILGQEMELAGWRNVSVSRVTEPRANTVGVFAEGRNTLYRSERYQGVNPIYMEMYPGGSPLLNHLRSYTLTGGPRRANIVLIDVGSFTTDLSVVDFDAGGDGDCIAGAKQTSYKLGIIAGFEQPLLRQLSEKHGFKVEELTFEGREAIKKALAEGTQFILTLPGNRNIALGQAEDRACAQHIATELASRVWDAYRGETTGLRVRYLILTGGGSSAPLVRNAIYSKFGGSESRWVDVEGMESPTTRRGALRRWPDTDEPLARLATALGASSVILDLPTAAPQPDEPRMRPIESPWVACSCNGGNKECMRCGGFGAYKRTGA